MSLLRIRVTQSGEIAVETELGSGSTFLFSVWLGVASGRARTGIVPKQLRSLRSLVVDDNAAAREILRNSLSNLCGRVDSVSSGAEAIVAVKQRDLDEPFDVIFMDWRMPGMDGLQATRLIREDPDLKSRPAVLLVTAFGIDEVREEAERILVDGFLQKPVTMSMLVDVLVSLFAAEAQAEDRAAHYPPVEHYEGGGLSGVRILLTEDNDINQQIATELLVGAGAIVDVANNGLEALGKLTNEPFSLNFDVVLMDLQMPLLDGYETTKQLRSDPRLADLPIIALTAHATVEELHKCLELGMNGHVAKPIDPAALFDAIRRVAMSRPDDRRVLPHVLPQTSASAQALRQDALSHISGLDSAAGLQRVAGNGKLYIKLLRQFAATEADAAERIAAALTLHDRVLAERLAHTVKGVAGNIGASSVQNAAANLEKAIGRSASAADIESWVATLGECITQVIGGLNLALDAPDDEPDAVADDPRQAGVILDQLSRYLADSDAAAVGCFESAAPQLRSLFGAEKYEKFARLIENYDFTEAYEQLRTASNEKRSAGSLI